MVPFLLDAARMRSAVRFPSLRLSLSCVGPSRIFLSHLPPRLTSFSPLLRMLAPCVVCVHDLRVGLATHKADDSQCTHFDVDKLEYVRPSMRCVCIVSCSLSLKICPILCFQSLRLIPSGPRPLPTTVDLIVMPV